MSEPEKGRYPGDVLKADGLRAIAGLVLMLGLLALAGFNAHPLVALVLLAGAVLFACLGVRSLLRAGGHYTQTADGLRFKEGYFTILVPWDQITDVKLRYFSTQKDRSDGWMQLTVRSGRRRHSIESHLNGFDTITAKLATVILERGLPVDQVTKQNFQSLGHYIG